MKKLLSVKVQIPRALITKMELQKSSRLIEHNTNYCHHATAQCTLWL